LLNELTAKPWSAREHAAPRWPGAVGQPIHEEKRRAAFRELGEIEGADRSRRNHALAERFDYKKGRLLNE
jgi:hypothetical protein